jgi:hypothetical protein
MEKAGILFFIVASLAKVLLALPRPRLETVLVVAVYELE